MIAARLAGKPWELPTGHRPPEVQVEGQIRTSTGFTIIGRNKLPPSIFGQGWRDAREPRDEGDAFAASPTGLLLAYLGRLARERAWLPPFTVMAQAAGVGTPSGKNNAKRARELLDELKARGDVDMRWKSAVQVSGTLALRLVEGGAVLRQSGAAEHPFG